MTGEFNHGEKILELLEQHRPAVCVELGTWQGGSAIPIARSIARWGGTLSCVDLWGGAMEYDAGARTSPVMLYTCARAMVDAGLANVRLVPAPTREAARYWSEPIDFLYVDADHRYDAVRGDLEAWIPRVRYGGLIVGDDYDGLLYPGVVRAWQELEQSTGATLVRHQSMIYGVKDWL